MKPRNFLFSLMAGTVLASAVTANPGDGNFYFFGDSGLSMGNLYITFPFPFGNPYSSREGLIHRESNGWVWPEYMLDGDVRPSLDPTGTSSNINFSFSGANSGPFGVGILETGEPDYFAMTGVHAQLAMFEGYLAESGTKIGSDDVFFIGAGANDYFNTAAFTPLNQITADLADNTVASIEFLVDKGAKYIFVEPVPDFDIAPLLLPASAEDHSFLRDLTTGAGNLQAQKVAELQNRLPDDVTVVSLRIDGAVYYMTDKAVELGFSNTKEGCVSSDGVLCSTDASKQNGYIFWDDLHLTTKAQKIQSQYYRAFMNAGFGLSGRYAARLPDLALQSLKGNAESIGDRAVYAPQKDFRLYMDSHFANGELNGGGSDIKTIFDYRRFGGGIEFGLTDKNTAGVAFHYLKGDADFGAAADPAGSVQSKAYIASVYGRLNEDRFFLETAFQHAWIDFDDFVRETGAPVLVAKAGTKAKAWETTVVAGYSLAEGAFELRSYASFRYARATVDAFDEPAGDLYGLALAYEHQKVSSKTAGVGLRGKLNTSVAGTDFAPWFDIHYSRELGDKSRTFGYDIQDNWARTIHYTTDKPERDLLRLDAGFSLALSKSIQFTASYGTEFLSKEKLNTSLRGSISFRF